MEKNGKTTKNVKEGAQQASATWESPKREWEWVRNERHGWLMAWAWFSKHLLGVFPNSNLTPILFPSPCINFPQPTFRWLGTKDKMGIWQLYGFSLRHLAFLHWLKGLNFSPPYSLWNHAPISITLRRIASCGIFINFHFTWCLKMYCAWLAHKRLASINRWT